MEVPILIPLLSPRVICAALLSLAGFGSALCVNGAPLPIKTFDGGVGNWSSLKELVAGDTVLYFLAEDGESDGEFPSLWKSDGTPEGTVLVRQIRPYLRDRSNMATIGDNVFFAVEGENGYQVWRSDGTANGTVRLLDSPTTETALAPHSFTAVGTNYLYFAAYDGLHGMELWEANSSSLAASLTTDIFPGDDLSGKKNNSSPENLVAAGSTLFFSADSAEYGRELWKVAPRGTTELVRDIYPGSGFAGMNDSLPGDLVYGGVEDNTLLDYIVFAARNTQGREFWRSNGTESGTFLVLEIESGLGNANPALFTRSDDTIFFIADQTGTGMELWRTTQPGAALVKDIYPGDPFGAPAPRELTDVRGTLFFSANDGVHGYELWRSDGTAEGTYMVKDIFPGSGDAQPRQLIQHNGLLYFSARDTNGYALWQSDGTSNGTQRVDAVHPEIGVLLNDPHEMAKMGGDLYIAVGRSLWKIPGESVVPKFPFLPSRRVGDWALSEWIGWYQDLRAPWIFHQDHGWWYTPEGSENGFWVYDRYLGWVYTSKSLYPWLYSAERAKWLYFQTGTNAPRWFYDRTDWFTITGSGG
jgi:ELWxxDGT repeat protein